MNSWIALGAAHCSFEGPDFRAEDSEWWGCHTWKTRAFFAQPTSCLAAWDGSCLFLFALVCNCAATCLAKPPPSSSSCFKTTVPCLPNLTFSGEIRKARVCLWPCSCLALSLDPLRPSCQFLKCMLLHAEFWLPARFLVPATASVQVGQGPSGFVASSGHFSLNYVPASSLVCFFLPLSKETGSFLAGRFFRPGAEIAICPLWQHLGTESVPLSVA